MAYAMPVVRTSEIPTSAGALEACISEFIDDTTISNGFVLALVNENKKDFSKVYGILEHRLNTKLSYTVDALRNSVNRLQSSQLGPLKKNLQRNGEQALNLLKTEFKHPTSGTKRKHEKSFTRALAALVPNCHACPILSDELSASAQKVETLTKAEKKYNKLKATHLKLQPKRVNQQLARKNSIVKKKCQEVRSLQKELCTLKSEFGKSERRDLYETNARLKSEIKKLKKQQLGLTRYYKTICRVPSHSKLERELKDAKHHVCILENKIEVLKENKGEIIDTKENQTYNATVRKCIYYALQHQCPVEHASNVVRYVVESFTDQKLEVMPSQTSVARMAREMSVLGDLQAGAMLTETQNCTLAWDATDIGGSHLNEVHISASSASGKKDYMTLGVTELAGGKTQDYANHITETIGDVATTFSGFTGSDRSHVLDTISEKISSTMSDRVAVNHCVNKELRESFGHTLTEFNCNIHPLDSMDKAAKTALKATEVKGTLWGKDCAAVNLIQGLCKMRYKQGTGDPKTFKAFFKSRQLPLKDIQRYVGNRFHVTFHLAGVFLRLRDELTEYLMRYSTVRGGLQIGLLTDLKDVKILQHLQILSLFGKLVTGPWMAELYTDEGLMTYYEGVDMIRCCMQNLESYQADPQDMLTTTTDAFGGDLDVTDPTLAAARAYAGDEETFKRVTSNVAERFVAVIRRQLARFLEGEDSEPSEHDIEQARSVPHHNMQAERIMALTDAEARRAPNATVDYIEAKVKAKANRTLQWLQHLPPNEQRRAIGFAVGHTRRQSKVKAERRQKMVDEITKRMTETSRKRDLQERRKMEKEVRQLEASKEVTKDVVANLSRIGDLQDEQANYIIELCQKPISLVGAKIVHTWYDEETEQDEVFHGEILKLRRRKKCTFVIGYHRTNESPDDSEDFDIERTQIITDLLYRDLVFVS